MEKKLLKENKERWILDEDGTMIVLWRGNMPNFFGIETPWEKVKDQIRAIVFADGITSVGAQAFKNCKNLESVDFPKTLSAINYEAFMGCTSLCEVIFPEHTILRHIQSEETGCRMCERIVLIKRKAFAHTPWCKETWGDFIISGDVLLESCNKKTEVAVPDGIREIAPYAFKDQPLLSVTFPDSLEKIGGFAFENTKLREVEIGNNVKKIGGGAFAKNPELRAAYFFNDNTEISANTFVDCYRDPVDEKKNFAVKSHGPSALQKFCKKNGIRFRRDHTRVERFRKLPYTERNLTGAHEKDAFAKLSQKYVIFAIMVNEETKEVEVVKSFKKRVIGDPIYGYRIRAVIDRLFYSRREETRNPYWLYYVPSKNNWYYTSLEEDWEKAAFRMDREFVFWKWKDGREVEKEKYRCEWYLSWEYNKKGKKLGAHFLEWWLLDHLEYHMPVRQAS